MGLAALSFALALGASASAQFAPTPQPRSAPNGPLITLYSQDHYNGPSLKLTGPTPNLGAKGFPYPAASFIVNRGRWLLCNAKNFAGTCITAGVGMYPTDFANGFAQTIASLRPVD